jgi:hypothetical protein
MAITKPTADRLVEGKHLLRETIMTDCLASYAGVITSVSGNRVYVLTDEWPPLSKWLNTQTCVAVADTKDEAKALSAWCKAHMLRIHAERERHRYELAEIMAGIRPLPLET